jgi:predicted transcriptional regulator
MKEFLTTIRLDANDWAGFKQVADARRQTRSALLRAWILRAIKQFEKESGK